MSTFAGSTIPTLTISPDYSGYTVTDSAETISIKLKGGASRYRKDILNSSSTVDCQWTLTAGQYDYWRAFYRTATISGSLPFYCALTMNRQGIHNFKCYFVPDSISVSDMDGDVIFVVQAQLEVIPIPANTATDNIIIAFNGNLQNVEDRLNTIVNYRLPSVPFN